MKTIEINYQDVLTQLECDKMILNYHIDIIEDNEQFSEGEFYDALERLEYIKFEIVKAKENLRASFKRI